MELMSADSVLSDSAAGEVAREAMMMKSICEAARMQPRDVGLIESQVEEAFSDPDLAADAEYYFERGSTGISGLTVIAARELARIWGSVRYGLKIIDKGDDWVLARGFAVDLQTLAYSERDGRFSLLAQRKVSDGGGGYVTRWVPVDERDQQDLINNRGARLVRNALDDILPHGLVARALRVAQGVRAKEAREELGGEQAAAKIAEVARAFGALGVTEEILEQRLCHPLSELTPEEYAELHTIYRSVKEDGGPPLSDFFEMGEVPAAASTEDSQTDDATALIARAREAGKRMAAEADAEEAAKRSEAEPEPASAAAPAPEEADGAAEPDAATAADSAPSEATERDTLLGELRARGESDPRAMKWLMATVKYDYGGVKLMQMDVDSLRDVRDALAGLSDEECAVLAEELEADAAKA